MFAGRSPRLFNSGIHIGRSPINNQGGGVQTSTSKIMQAPHVNYIVINQNGGVDSIGKGGVGVGVTGASYGTNLLIPTSSAALAASLGGGGTQDGGGGKRNRDGTPKNMGANGGLNSGFLTPTVVNKEAA